MFTQLSNLITLIARDNGIPDSTDMNLKKPQEIVKDSDAGRAAIPEVTTEQQHGICINVPLPQIFPFMP